MNKIIKLDESRYYLYTFITQFASSCLFIKYISNKIKDTTVLKLEIILQGFKMLKEIRYKKFNFSLGLHHSLLIMGCLLAMIKKYKKYRFLLVHSQIIHFPLMFYNLSKFIGNKNNIMYYLYIITWFPTILYRNLLNFYYSKRSSSKILHLSSNLLTILDLYWTPWNDYIELRDKLLKE